MPDIRFRPFDQQRELLRSERRFLGGFAGKRGGKTEVGAIKSILWQENKPHDLKTWGNIDPYLGLICAPTYEMLRDLSWKKFIAYAQPFIKREWQSPKIIQWHDGSEIRGVSADKPERLEGKKVHWAWIDEVFQVKEHFFLEMQARVADTMGYILATGSLGIQYINPKAHWAHRTFKQSKDPNFFVKEWTTLDNPHFPQQELERLKLTLDERTFKAMFEINWDTIAKNAVYADWSGANECNYEYNPELPLFISIDWGWAHPCACLFIQYDPDRNVVIVIDEIIESHLKLEDLYRKILSRGYDVTAWFCDIAGSQEREQTGISNVKWFEERGVEFNFRQSAVLYGVSLVRRYVKSFSGERRLFVDSIKCPLLIEMIKNYRYAEKNGEILNENPVKENDDGCDALRYFFVNYLDDDLNQKIVTRPR